MKKIYLSILMILCPLLPGMAQQVSQTGRETVGQTGLRASAAQVSKPFLQEGKEWYYRSVYGPRGADINYYCKISGDTLAVMFPIGNWSTGRASFLMAYTKRDTR